VAVNSVFDQHFVEIPALELGVPARPEATIQLPRLSPLAQTYEQAVPALGRVEVLAREGNGGMSGRLATAFAVSEDGKLATTNHLVDNALDISVFDSTGRVHRADVIASNPDMDIAVLQLRDPASYSSFRPLPIDTTPVDPLAQTGPFALVGYPNGWQRPFLSVGQALNSARPLAAARFQLHGTEGACGSPIMYDGKVMAIFKQGQASTDMDVMGTPSRQLARLLDTLSPTNQVVAPLPIRIASDFQIGSPESGQANLERLFGSNYSQSRPADFFHSRVRTIQWPGGGDRTLTLQMQYVPSQQLVSIEPIALDGAPVPRQATWPGTDVPVSGSRLSVALDQNGLPQAMRAVNDPLSFLSEGFNYRGTGNYLASLEPRPVADPNAYLPLSARFIRGSGNGGS
jgi:hypothetical protein